MATIRYRWGNRGYVAIGVLTLAIAAAIGYRGESFEGVVVRIVDGDTLCLQGEAGEFTLRLWGVDAPELRQSYGKESKDVLGRLCIGETVKVVVKDVDRYSRRVVTIRLQDGRDVANEMLRLGAAWWYADYAPRDAVKKGLMLEARASKIGLWRQPSEPPWTYRSRR